MKQPFGLIAAALMMIATAAAQTVPAPPAGVTRPRYVFHVTQAGVQLGDIVIELFPDVAPKHCANFDSLVAAKFYDGTAFHRVIPGFMIQGGGMNSKNPNAPRNTWGISDPSQRKIPAEFNKISHVRGILSAARTADPNSAASQFFICVANAPHLDGQYTVYGQVVTGLEVVDKIVNAQRDNTDNPLQRIDMKVEKLVQKTVRGKNAPKKTN
ncbi:MAG: peptidyl-prolyl cis-trans isomerase A [Chlorobi bacterium OLB7]|nr:MAG: peptidyl-prolyl cis-trans isomerase A [Chlorobi bacterium OLB7]